ncbi:LON peptidase N-terminal domain and RING finger protein 1-like [Anneissia japonica]|uniref:LON peptidase N-terminal domain and RING finger protein 1-like n=1 Tax=Anneissia japonica TaxID=1529436 RepID=UPI001425B35A|nr:LON peptidase N-terminal domain and RING finger protein 1-like [Anneissia japonica]
MEELRGASKGHGESLIPLFICTIAFPTIPCPLHIFEPRYRLMIRQCIESGSRQFGMCVPSEQNEFSDYGCMLKIKEVQTLPDGRSIITTVGGKRFKVLGRGMREGYNTANVRFIEDDTVQEDDINQLNTLHQSVYSEASSWFNALRSVFRSRISKHYGGMPVLPENPLESPDGPGWTWWLLAVLPVAPRAQLECMSMTSLRERLLFPRRCLRAASES